MENGYRDLNIMVLISIDYFYSDQIPFTYIIHKIKSTFSLLRCGNPFLSPTNDSVAKSISKCLVLLRSMIVLQLALL